MYFIIIYIIYYAIYIIEQKSFTYCIPLFQKLLNLSCLFFRWTLESFCQILKLKGGWINVTFIIFHIAIKKLGPLHLNFLLLLSVLCGYFFNIYFYLKISKYFVFFLLRIKSISFSIIKLYMVIALLQKSYFQLILLESYVYIHIFNK